MSESRDLTILERHGALRRVHGGAIPVERLGFEPGVELGSERLVAEKERMAKTALPHLPDEGTVLLDAGTTTLRLAELLPHDHELTIVSNSLGIASLVAPHPNLSLYLLGGRVRGRTLAAVGAWVTNALQDVFIDVAFIGTNGLSAERGLTTPDQSEAAAKRPELLDTQLTALGTAAGATGADVRVMAPMVATAEEAAWFARRVREHGLMVVGVMIEVPAAALRSRQVLAEVDFASIGTNDLAQYTLAADRIQGELATLLDPWQPAVLDLVAAACDGGRRMPVTPLRPSQTSSWSTSSEPGHRRVGGRPGATRGEDTVLNTPTL